MANRSATRTREIGPLSIRAEFAPSTLNPDKRTVQLTWTTGARVLRGSYDPYWEELSLDPKHVRLDRLRSGSAPLLANHSSGSLDDVIGVVESAQLDAGGVRGSATVRFDRGAAGEEAYRKVSDGILRNVSPIPPPSAASAIDVDKEIVLPTVEVTSANVDQFIGKGI